MFIPVSDSGLVLYKLSAPHIGNLTHGALKRNSAFCRTNDRTAPSKILTSVMYNHIQTQRLQSHHRTTELQEGSNPPAKAGPIKKAAHVDVQAGLELLQERRLQNLPRQPVSVLLHPHHEEVLLRTGVEFPLFQCMGISPCPVPKDH